MSLLCSTKQFGRELCEALGIKNCRSIELRVAADEAVTLKTESCVTDEQGRKILELIRKYDMVERIDIVDVTTLRDDATHYTTVDAIGSESCKASVQTIRPIGK